MKFIDLVNMKNRPKSMNFITRLNREKNSVTWGVNSTVAKASLVLFPWAWVC